MTAPHLDDETLSAALDGEDAAVAAHLAGCAACRGRGDALDRARRAVAAAAPSGAPPGLADRAVAAAIAAYTAERSATPSPTASPGRDGVVVPLRPDGRQADSFTSRRTSPTVGSSRRRVPAWAMGVAAAVAAMLVAVPLLTREPGGGADQTVAAARDQEAKMALDLGAEPVVDGGDLGDQSDQLALGSVLAAALAGDASPPAAAPVPATTAGSTADADAAAGPSRAAAPGAAATEASPASPAVVPSLSAPLPGDVSPPADSATTADTAYAVDAGAVAACEDAVRSEFATGLGSLLYRATLRWQGTPSVLLAYRLADTSGNGPDHRAFVMALDGCRLLVVQGF